MEFARHERINGKAVLPTGGIGAQECRHNSTLRGATLGSQTGRAGLHHFTDRSASASEQVDSTRNSSSPINRAQSLVSYSVLLKALHKVEGKTGVEQFDMV